MNHAHARMAPKWETGKLCEIDSGYVDCVEQPEGPREDWCSKCAEKIAKLEADMRRHMGALR